MKSMKEMAIREYISNIDFKNDNWKLSEIKQNMRIFLGEEPGVDITYKSDILFNEFLSEAKEIKVVDKVSIVFTDLDEKFKKIEFLIN